MDIDKKLQQYRKILEPAQEQEDRVFMKVFQDLPAEKTSILKSLFQGASTRYALLAASIALVFIVPLSLGVFQSGEQVENNEDKSIMSDVSTDDSDDAIMPRLEELLDSDAEMYAGDTVSAFDEPEDGTEYDVSEESTTTDETIGSEESENELSQNSLLDPKAILNRIWKLIF